MANTGYRYITISESIAEEVLLDELNPDLGFREELKFLVQIFKLYDTEFAGPNGEGLDRSNPERERKFRLNSSTLEDDVKLWLNTMYTELSDRDELYENRQQLSTHLFTWGDPLPGSV